MCPQHPEPPCQGTAWGWGVGLRGCRCVRDSRSFLCSTDVQTLIGIGSVAEDDQTILLRIVRAPLEVHGHTPKTWSWPPSAHPPPLMQNGCRSDTGTRCKIRELSNSISAALAEPNPVCGHPKSRMSTRSPQRNKLWRFGLRGEDDVLDEGDTRLCSAGYCELMNVYPPTQVSQECPRGYRYILGSMRQQVLQIWASGAHAAASRPAVRPRQRSTARERS